MFEFVKRLFSDKRQVTEKDTIDESNLTGEESLEPKPDDRPVVELSLSLHSDWSIEKEKISFAEKEIMEKEVKELPPIKAGDISIVGIYAIKTERLEVGFYICNGLDRPIKFDDAPLVITNLQNEVLAKQVFNLSEIGEIPQHSVRPWEVFFNKESLFAETIQHDDWKIAFDLQPAKAQTVNVELEELSEELGEEQRNYLKNYLDLLPALKPGELNISALQAKVQEDGKLLATVVIRNGGKRAVKLERLPLAIKDAKGQEVAVGLFNVENLVVKACKARLWTFAFPKELISGEDIDLSKWAVYLKN